MEMFNPPHPGEIVREDCLIPAGLSVTDAAKHLGVSRQSMSELLNGRNGISADMALRLEKAGWSTAESWLRNQASYDLWQARNLELTALAKSAKVRELPEYVKPAKNGKAAAKKAAVKKALAKAAGKRTAPARKRA
jgi:addiction module HigA family antidote